MPLHWVSYMAIFLTVEALHQSALSLVSHWQTLVDDLIRVLRFRELKDDRRGRFGRRFSCEPPNTLDVPHLK